MSRRIKLMADYGSHSLWGVDTDDIGNIEPATLPLSQKLIEDLEKWAEAYDQTLNWDDPGSSVPLTEQELKAFDDEGIGLWKQLQLELGPKYEVFYFSERLHSLLTNPAVETSAD